jgi:hypothetical protein
MNSHIGMDKPLDSFDVSVLDTPAGGTCDNEGGDGRNRVLLDRFLYVAYPPPYLGVMIQGKIGRNKGFQMVHGQTAPLICGCTGYQELCAKMGMIHECERNVIDDDVIEEYGDDIPDLVELPLDAKGNIIGMSYVD